MAQQYVVSMFEGEKLYVETRMIYVDMLMRFPYNNILLAIKEAVAIAHLLGVPDKR